jgi:hypothetical protein
MASEGYFFIADLLGFGKIVKNLSDEEMRARVQGWVDLVRSSMQAERIEQFQLISDTVFAATPSTSEGLGQLVGLGRRLLNDGIHKSLPLRGAIVHGTYTWGHDLIYGKAVIDAHMLEMSQNWIGIACEPNLPHSNDHRGFGKLIGYMPPKKRGPGMTQPVVDWDVPPIKTLTELVGQGGLLRDGEDYTWELLDKVNNTSSFAMYKHSVRVAEKDPASNWGLPNAELTERVLGLSDPKRSE